MRHHYTHEGLGAHFGAGTDCFGKVVTQLGDINGGQTRLKLTPAEARAYAAKLLEVAEKAEGQCPAAEVFDEAQTAQ